MLLWPATFGVTMDAGGGLVVLWLWPSVLCVAALSYSRNSLRRAATRSSTSECPQGASPQSPLTIAGTPVRSEQGGQAFKS